MCKFPTKPRLQHVPASFFLNMNRGWDDITWPYLGPSFPNDFCSKVCAFRYHRVFAWQSMCPGDAGSGVYCCCTHVSKRIKENTKTKTSWFISLSSSYFRQGIQVANFLGAFGLDWDKPTENATGLQREPSIFLPGEPPAEAKKRAASH